MGWNDLAGNRAVSGDNLSGSSIVAKPGQSLPTGQKAITRAQANAWLSVQPVPDDNKLVLKQELVAVSPLILITNSASTGSSSGAACGLVTDGHISLYSVNGTFDVGDGLVYGPGGGQWVQSGYYAFIKNGISYWIKIHSIPFGDSYLDGFIESKGNCPTAPVLVNNLIRLTDVSRQTSSSVRTSMSAQFAPTVRLRVYIIYRGLNGGSYNSSQFFPAGQTSSFSVGDPPPGGVQSGITGQIIAIEPASDGTYNYTFTNEIV